MSLILHLSDLHLSPVEHKDVADDFKSDIVPLSERTTRLTALKESMTQLAGHLKQQGRQLDCVVISGDITVAYDETGFRKLEEVLDWLGDVRPASNRIVIVPGNHDVKWEVSGDPVSKYGLFRKYVRDQGYITPLLEGIDLTNGDVTASDLTKHFLLDPDFGWAVVPINSSHYCGSVEPLTIIPEAAWKSLSDAVVSANPTLNEKDVADELRRLRLRDVARISVPGQLNAIRALVNSIKQKMGPSVQRPVLIGVLHHHLLPVSIREEFKPFESITNLGHLRYALRDNGFSVILHGHKHADSVFFDYVHKNETGEMGSPHRLLVISSPSIEKPGTVVKAVGRLIEFPAQVYASSLSLTDIPSGEAGLNLLLPKPRAYPIWQPGQKGLFSSSPVNIIEGDSIDEVYERVLALFFGTSTSALIPNVICRVSHAGDPVSLPTAYPALPDVPNTERAGWFRKIVDWWQKKAFSRLSGDHHFNHGSRIYRYDPFVNQLDRVVEAIRKDRGTSRGVISLLNPHADDPEKESSRFPSFCFVQFLLRDLADSYSLEVIAHFRKQEMRYWWPVNVAELSRLQAEVVRRVRTAVEGGRPKPLKAGIITTVAATAHVGTKIPYILVPAIDFDLEESPQKLWDMTYAVCWKDMKDRAAQITTWEKVLATLIPPTEQDPDGVPVPIQGIEYLGEIADHFGSNHGGHVGKLAGLWRKLASMNREHARTMAAGHGKLLDSVHTQWRNEVLVELNEIRKVVSEAFGVPLAEIK
jgi:3',5'-cyclic AMP phosphodiesterase CpdA